MESKTCHHRQEYSDATTGWRGEMGEKETEAKAKVKAENVETKQAFSQTGRIPVLVLAT